MITRPHAFSVPALAQLVLLWLLFSGSSLAGPFSPIKFVNGLAITQFEFDQRVLFMTLLRQPGDIEAEAMRTLIDDRLKQSLALQYDFQLPSEMVQSGMEQFASQANLTAQQFVEALGKGGVEQETFRDFVESGLLWREVVQAKLGPTIVISEADIDRALAGNQPLGALKLRMSEIVINATGPGRGAALAEAHHIGLELKAGADFATLARKYSDGPTARSGGALDWLLLSQLKPDAALAVRSLNVDQVSQPVVLDDTVVIYLMQEKKQEDLPPATTKVVDYAEFLVADNATEIAKIRNTVDSCDDLNELAQGLPADRLRRQTVPMGQLPPDVAGALVTLDPGESSTALARGGWRVFLMLCRRGAPETEQPSRDEVALQLKNQRLGTLAEIYIEELRSEANITDP